MTHSKALSTTLPLLAALILGACSDASAPSARAMSMSPSALVIGSPDLSDFHNITGQVWVCPDTPTPSGGFFFAWKITDNATNTLVSSGTVKNASAQQCLMLASVSTSTPGRYTAWVKEDPGSTFVVSGITASYGTNFPNTPPTPTVNIGKRWISSLITHDFGVLFTFQH